MQLDVEVSPPALWQFLLDILHYITFLTLNYWLTLTHLTFNLDPCDYDFWSSDFSSSDFLSSLNFGQVQTDRKRCIWAHRAYAQVGSKKN